MKKQYMRVSLIKSQLFSHWGFGPGLIPIYKCPACKRTNARGEQWGLIQCNDCGVITETQGEYRNESEPLINIWFSKYVPCSPERNPHHWRINSAGGTVSNCGCNTSGDNKWHVVVETNGPHHTFLFGPFDDEESAQKVVEEKIFYCTCGSMKNKDFLELCNCGHDHRKVPNKSLD